MVYMYHSFLIHSSADGHLSNGTFDFSFGTPFRTVNSSLTSVFPKRERELTLLDAT